MATVVRREMRMSWDETRDPSSTSRALLRAERNGFAIYDALIGPEEPRGPTLHRGALCVVAEMSGNTGERFASQDECIGNRGSSERGVRDIP